MKKETVVKTKRKQPVNWRRITFLIIATFVVISMLGQPLFALFIPSR